MGRHRGVARLVQQDHLYEIEAQLDGEVRLWVAVIEACIETAAGGSVGDHWYFVMDARDFLRHEAADLLHELAQWCPGLGNIRMARRLEKYEAEWAEDDLQRHPNHPVRLYDQGGKGKLPAALVKSTKGGLRNKSENAQVLEALARRRGITNGNEERTVE